MSRKKGNGRLYKTIHQKEINVDIEREQSVTINFGGFSMMLWKNYPNSSDQRVKRQYERRKAYGQCIRYGCPEKAKEGFAQCKKHIELDRWRYKMGMKYKPKMKRKNETKK